MLLFYLPSASTYWLDFRLAANAVASHHRATGRQHPLRGYAFARFVRLAVRCLAIKDAATVERRWHQGAAVHPRAMEGPWVRLMEAINTNFGMMGDALSNVGCTGLLTCSEAQVHWAYRRDGRSIRQNAHSMPTRMCRTSCRIIHLHTEARPAQGYARQGSLQPSR